MSVFFGLDHCDGEEYEGGRKFASVLEILQSDDFQKTLDDLGGDQWEAVSHEVMSAGVSVLMKRPDYKK